MMRAEVSKRRRINVDGLVQGVGFRPFVYRLARSLNLGGYVNNRSDGVVIEVEGTPESVELFCSRLNTQAPVLADIIKSRITDIDSLGEADFIIRESHQDSKPSTLISPDVAVCDDCLGELFDPENRRYRYPFINCTNCGPRYTIVDGIPYDRPKTSMKVFPLCGECEREYNDPNDRRFHAQPNACPVCGPKLVFCNRNGKTYEGDPVGLAVEHLRGGRVIAMRGIGGFHLAVDAQNNDAIQELRERKGRAEKPLALMSSDINDIKKYCFLSGEEENLITHHTRPIVLLLARSSNGLAEAIAPDNRYLGFILAYSPLHHLILRGNFDALVMTSGNFSEEPIATGNDEALNRLSSLADYFLLHNREILQRCDDSISRFSSGKNRLIRRARGYVPRPVFLHRPTRRNILACGSELKNTIAISRDDRVFLSQHIGDLDNPAAMRFFEDSILHLQKILEIKPELIVCDLHPEYLSSKWAKKQRDLPVIGAQHHHAHLASVMAENGVSEPVIGIILDGTGYGLDGSIWGGEILIGDAKDFIRYAYLEPVAMPGGTAAINNPWRMAVSNLYKAFGGEFLKFDLPFLNKIDRRDVSIIVKMIEKGINSPLTSSCGRLFDAVSAMLNIRNTVNYEAQAAIELEMAVDENHGGLYEEAVVNIKGPGAIPIDGLIRGIVDDIKRNVSEAVIASKFHQSLAEIFISVVKTAKQNSGKNKVALSGGVFQNDFFFTYMFDRLIDEGFDVLTHNKVPTNDGGLALGQVVIADAKSDMSQDHN